MMKIYVLIISLFALSSLYKTLACKDKDCTRDIEKFKQEVDLDKSIRKSIDDLKDDESDNVMQSYENLLEAIGAGPCTCDRRECTCCAFKQYRFIFWKIPVRACYRLIPLAKHYEAALIFFLDGHPVYHNIINMTKPPAKACGRVPKFPRVLTRSEICVKFSKINVAKRQVCAFVTGWIKITLKKYNFYANYGCVTLPDVWHSDQKYLNQNPEFDDSKFPKASSSDLEDVKRSDEGQNDVDGDTEDIDDLKMTRIGEYDLDETELPGEDEVDLGSYLEETENMRKTIANHFDELGMSDEGHNGPSSYTKDVDDDDMIRHYVSDLEINEEIDEKDSHDGDEAAGAEKDEDFFFLPEA